MTGTAMPLLQTQRLRIRPFEMGDLEDVYRLLDVELREAETGSERMDSLAARAEWLRWAVLNYDQLALLYQPPYGDRAVVLQDSGEMVGACGFVPCLMPFEQLPALAPARPAARPGHHRIWPVLRRFPGPPAPGYAAEAARALVDYAFSTLTSSAWWRPPPTTTPARWASCAAWACTSSTTRCPSRTTCRWSGGSTVRPGARWIGRLPFTSARRAFRKISLPWRRRSRPSAFIGRSAPKNWHPSTPPATRSICRWCCWPRWMGK